MGAVLAAAEYAGASGREFLTALAVAYQVQCRLSDEAPVRAKGFDHTTQGAYAVIPAPRRTAEGIRNVLSVTGDPPHIGDYPGSRGVYEVDAIGLAAIISRLNEGIDFAGKQIDTPTSFYIGVAVNPSADDLELEVERFRRKIAAGAQFAMTQALFDIAYLDRFLDAFGGESPIPILAGIWPLQSFELASGLHNEVPGITVPEELQRRLAEAGPDAAAVGLELARTQVEECRSRTAGIYVIPPFKAPEAALELLAP